MATIKQLDDAAYFMDQPQEIRKDGMWWTLLVNDKVVARSTSREMLGKIATDLHTKGFTEAESN